MIYINHQGIYRLLYGSIPLKEVYVGSRRVYQFVRGGIRLKSVTAIAIASRAEADSAGSAALSHSGKANAYLQKAFMIRGRLMRFLAEGMKAEEDLKLRNRPASPQRIIGGVPVLVGDIPVISRKSRPTRSILGSLENQAILAATSHPSSPQKIDGYVKQTVEGCFPVYSQDSRSVQENARIELVLPAKQILRGATKERTRMRGGLDLKMTSGLSKNDDTLPWVEESGSTLTIYQVFDAEESGSVLTLE